MKMSLEELDDAISQDDVHTVERLLRALCTDIEPRNSMSLLHMAAIIGHIGCVRFLMDCRQTAVDGGPWQETLRQQDSMTSWTPLMYAVASGDGPAVRTLLDVGGNDIDAKDAFEQTALHLAAQSSNDAGAETVGWLVEAGADVDVEDRMHMTPFLRAVEADNFRVARFLHGRGCDIGCKRMRGRSALHLAAACGSEEMIAWLLSAGCDTNARDDDRRTALMLLAQHRCEPHRVYQAMKLLITAGASLDDQDMNGDTVLLHAVGHLGTVSHNHVQLLLDAGADADVVNHVGVSALWQAVFDGYRHADRLPVVQMLVNENCRLNTPCRGKLLFTSGADSVFCYETAMSPFEAAMDCGYYAAARLLLYGGAHVQRDMWYDTVCDVPRELRWFQRISENPHRLEHHCRLAVRRAVGPHIRLKVVSLPIPRRLQSYLLLEDVLLG